MSDRFATWPDVLRQLALLIGAEATLRLARAEGGLSQTYIPRTPVADHPWARVIGPDAWAEVVAAFGGQRVNLPRGTRIRLKKVEILDLAESGRYSNREIARRVGADERHVRRVLRYAGYGRRRAGRPSATDADFPERLEWIIANRFGGSVIKLAQAVGLSGQQSVLRWRQREGGPSPRNLEKLAAAAGVREEWLRRGEGPRTRVGG